MPPTPDKNAADAQRDLAAATSTLAGRPAPTGKRQLSGRERAAVLMLALGEQYGGKIWGLLDDDELRELSVAMSAIGPIDAEIVENLLLEFVIGLGRAHGQLRGHRAPAATISAA
jgi:flagellar motor switch protein FliG